jgi:hypothetical protein
MEVMKMSKTMTKATTEQLKRIALDMFNSETRRGWIAIKCSSLGDDADPNITEEKYVQRFVEKNKGCDLDELEDIADIVRPSNMPTAYEREVSR